MKGGDGHLVLGQLGHSGGVSDLRYVADRTQAVRDCLFVLFAGMQPQYVNGGDAPGLGGQQLYYWEPC